MVSFRDFFLCDCLMRFQPEVWTEDLELRATGPNTCSARRDAGRGEGTGEISEVVGLNMERV